MTVAYCLNSKSGGLPWADHWNVPQRVVSWCRLKRVLKLLLWTAVVRLGKRRC